MHVVGPGETLTITQSGIPTGRSVGLQLIKAASGSVALGRSTTGVVERPAGSGNYVATFIAPVEADVYVIVLDWNSGHITSATSKTDELQVTTTAASVNTGLGEIADYVKTNLGGESFQMLVDSANYGAGFITIAIETVKARLMLSPVTMAQENTLPAIVLSYFGKLAALELRQAVYDIWQTKAQSRAVANDPVETVTYASRVEMLKALFEALASSAEKDRPIATPLIPGPVLLGTGPEIDEDAGARVTPDPRTFPRQNDFPYRGGYPPYVGAGDAQRYET